MTVENLTPAGSQPLSPPLVVVHSSRADVWSVGTIANHGVAAIAEDANNAPLEEVLPGVRGVTEVFTVAGGPIPPGATRTFEVETRGPANRLSLLTMLVNTNDAFTGLDSLRVRGQGMCSRRWPTTPAANATTNWPGSSPGRAATTRSCVTPKAP
ncbi:MAG: spondin domain-containing protein [Acidimicrobiales bacterium]